MIYEIHHSGARPRSVYFVIQDTRIKLICRRIKDIINKDMSQYYKPNRTRNLFDPESQEPFKLSRSKIDLFLECPRCFYLDRRLGVGRPAGFPFTLNKAVDILLKKEFDIHRARQTSHPLIKAYGLKAVPFDHEKINEWRDNFVGVRHLHPPTNFLIFGAIDDVWLDEEGQLLVVDYKATSKQEEVNLDAEWQEGYKRQMEIYQWLLRRNDFKVSDTGYFVYVNGKTDREAFDGKLEFDISIIPYDGHDDWVEETILQARQCLSAEKIPAAANNCDYCQYVGAVAKAG